MIDTSLVGPIFVLYKGPGGFWPIRGYWPEQFRPIRAYCLLLKCFWKFFRFATLIISEDERSSVCR